MAKVKLNPILEQIRGQVGDLVFKHYGDDVIITRKPDMSEVEPSPAQLAHRERFRRATEYGKQVLADPEAKAFYQQAAQEQGKPLLSLTLADFFNAPSVEAIDLDGYRGRAGDPITVLAQDDFQVRQVEIEITDDDGNLFETGLAVQDEANPERWRYVARTDVASGESVHITATASDRPGGSDVKSIEKQL